MARLIKDKYEAWKEECNTRFFQLKGNEEKLNKTFIDLYKLKDELSYGISNKDVTIHYIVDKKDDADLDLRYNKYLRTKKDEIKDLISYAVGCLFGRFSIDYEGLAYAGGTWDESRYQTIIPVSDNILTISQDGAFDNDIVDKFINFIELVYGKETLEDNLQFIADAIEINGSPRQAIREYFLTDFYKDHCKMYKKRPIYWLFDSGKKNGFKALIYLHRYNSNLLPTLISSYAQKDEGLADYKNKLQKLADKNINLDLDKGVIENYKILEDVLAKIK